MNGNQHNDWRREMNQVFKNANQHNNRLREMNQVFENVNQHTEQWRERNPVQEKTSQHTKRWREKMAQEGRKKTINDILDVMNQVFENTSRHNEWRQGRKQVVENVRYNNKQGGL